MHVEHAYPIVTRMAESRPEEAVVASRYNFRVVTTGQEFVSVSDYPTCMVRGPLFSTASAHLAMSDASSLDGRRVKCIKTSLNLSRIVGYI